MHSAALRYVDAVARFGSIRRAAAELNISASAINRQILQLEEQLGVELFERRASGMQTTEFGEMVVEHARRTLHDYEAMKSEIGFGRRRLSGTVRVATLDSLTVKVLPETLIGLRNAHPDVTLNVRTGGPVDIRRLVANDSADIGLTFGNQVASGVEVRHEVPAPMCAIVRADHPLSRRRRISVFDCDRHDVIMQDNTGPLSDFMGDEMAALRRVARPVLVADNIISAKAMILHGGCVGFFTRFGFLEEIEAGTIVAVPLTESAPSSLTFVTIVSSTRRTNRAVEAFVERLSAILDKEAVYAWS